MQRHQFWIFLGLAVALGCGLQFVKSPKPQHVHVAGFAKFKALLEEGRAVVGADTGPLVIAKADVEDKDNEIAAPAAAASPTNAEKKADAKKKKPSPSPSPSPSASPSPSPSPAMTPSENPTPANKSAAKPDDPEFAAGGVANAASPSPSPHPAGADGLDGGDIPQTAAAWEDLLLNDPSYAKTSQLINDFKDGRVSSAVFYQTVEAMLADSKNSQVQSYGVMALGSTPSAQSFELLNQFNESSNANASITGQDKVYLQTYSNLQYVSILNSVLSSGTDTGTKQEALSLLQIAVNAALGGGGGSSGGNGGQPTAQSTGGGISPATINIFNAFKSTLTNLESSGGTLASQSQQDLSLIESL